VRVDVVTTGEYQPAERKFGLPRKMLEVCLELGFPVSGLERSPFFTVCWTAEHGG
jgi:DNA repair photolyase